MTSRRQAIIWTNDKYLTYALIFWKATKVGSPPNFPKLVSQLRGIPQPQYFVPSLLEPHWTYLWKHYIYHKKTPKLVAKFWLPNLVLYQTDYLEYQKRTIKILQHSNVNNLVLWALRISNSNDLKLIFRVRVVHTKHRCNLITFNLKSFKNHAPV